MAPSPCNRLHHCQLYYCYGLGVGIGVGIGAGIGAGLGIGLGAGLGLDTVQ